jgi:hypothetical protein
MTIEDAVKAALAHRQRTRELMTGLGDNDLHPDHSIIREALCIAVVIAIDDQCLLFGMPRMPDAELPDLMRTLDGIADRIFKASQA